MKDYEFPCPYCCKHITINLEESQKGGIFKCQHCGNSVRLGRRETKPNSSSKNNR